MKPNFLLITIAVLISALIGYGFYAANSGEINQLLITFGSGVCSAVTLICAFGIKSERAESNVNIRVLSIIFFILLMISNLIFGFSKVVTAPYIIVNGIILLAFILVTYAIDKANE